MAAGEFLVDHRATLQFNVPGTLTTGTSKAIAVVPFRGRVVRVFAKVRVSGTQGGGGSTVPTLDLNKNGTSLVGGTLATFATTATAATYDAGVVGELVVAEGDILSLDIDLLFNGSAPAPVQPIDLVVAIVIERDPHMPVETGKIQFTE